MAGLMRANLSSEFDRPGRQAGPPRASGARPVCVSTCTRRGDYDRITTDPFYVRSLRMRRRGYSTYYYSTDACERRLEHGRPSVGPQHGLQAARGDGRGLHRHSEQNFDA